MKVLSTDGLTKLIELIKGAFISVDDTVSTNSVTLATVATSGSYNDLSNKPTIPDEQVQSDWNVTNTSSKAYIKNKPTIPTAITIDTALSTTSTNPVQNKVITTELNKKIEGISSSDVTTALGYTPYNNSNPSGYQANKIETIKVNGTAQTITSKAVNITVPTNNNQLTNGAGYITNSALTPYALSEDLATVATSGSYNDLSNKPTIPAAQVNADWNATSGKAQILNKPTIPTVPTNVSAFTNDAGYTTNVGTVTSVNNTQPDANGNVTISVTGGANTDLSNLSSTGEAHFLKNIATGTNGLTIGGSASTANSATNIGFASSAGPVGTAVGYNTAANGSRTTSIGYNARIGAAASDAIQIGSGTNPTARTLCVGFYNYGNYPMLDGTTGKIPTDRLDTDATVTSGSTKPVTSGAVYDALQNAGGGSSRNIGEIVSSTIPLTDAGLHLLDGALINGSGVYSAFVTYIAGLDLTANYFCTEQEWQDSVTQYGVCGKFVYDSINNTVRLPKYNSKIYTGGGTAPVKGNGLSLGLTDGNITQSFIQQAYNDARVFKPSNYISSALPVTGAQSGSGFYSGVMGVTTDSTKSGLIAQLSDITTSLDGYYYIVVATSTKTDIQVDIDEIATDLNGKADNDLSNINASSSAKKMIDNWGCPDYSAGITMGLPANPLSSSTTTYTCPSAGVIKIHAYKSNAGGSLTLAINNNIIGLWTAYGAFGVTQVIPVSKNDVIKAYTDMSTEGWNIQFQTFYPLKGEA